VITHRDPVKVLGSLGSLIGTLEWMRSDSGHPERMRAVVYGFAMLLGHVTALRDSGHCRRSRSSTCATAT